MKKFAITLVFSLLTVIISAQTPQAIKYQAVVRDNSGNILSNQLVGFRISIRTGNPGGTVVYQETHLTTTNLFGLANLNIGEGVPILGTFSSIDWSTGSKYMETELDLGWGSNYVSIGTSRMLSVPYALYSENTANVDDADADPGNELQIISKLGNLVSLSDGGGDFIDEVNDADIDPGNELQGLSILGDELSISDGNTVTLPSGLPTGYLNQTLRHNGTGWEASSNLFNDGAFIGIGIPTPSNGKLEVVGGGLTAIYATSNGLDAISATADGGGGFSAGKFMASNFGTYGIFVQSDDFDAIHASSTGPNYAAIYAMGTSGAYAGIFNGSVGIGTENPAYNLDVTGDINFTGDLYKNGVLLDMGWPPGSAGQTIFYNGTDWVASDNIFNSGTDVGIGSTSPGSKLDVNGDINTSTEYRINGNTVVSIGGSENILLGKGAGGANTGNKVTFVGDNSGFHNTGYYNTFVGSESGYSNTSGTFNTFIGLSAAYYNTTGSRNTFVGHLAGVSNTVGESNVAIGEFAGHWANGNYGTYIGSNAGFSSVGDSNIYLGYGAGYSNVVGNNNVYIGNMAGFYKTGSNELIIASGASDDNILIYGDFTSGNLGLGTTAPQSELEIYNNQDDWNKIHLNNPNGGSSAGSAIYFYEGGGYQSYIASTNTGNTNAISGPNSLTLQSFGGPVEIRTVGGGNYPISLSASGSKVGIGTNNPQGELEIYKDQNDWTKINLSNPNGGSNAGSIIYFNEASGYQSYIASANSGNSIASAGPNSLALQNSGGPIEIRTAGVGYFPLILLPGDNNVGIGTYNPIGKLDVKSNKRYSGRFISDSTSSETHVVHAEYSGAGADSKGVYGKSFPADYYGYGGYFVGGYMAARAEVTPSGNSTYYGFYSSVIGGSGFNYAIYGTSAGTGVNYSGYFNGNVTVTGTFANPSDEKLKKNIHPFTNALSKVNELSVHSYEFRNKRELENINLPAGSQIGFTAQEMEKVFPHLVSEQVHTYDRNQGVKDAEKDNQQITYKGINHIGMIPVLTQAIKEQQEIIEELKERIEVLESR